MDNIIKQLKRGAKHTRLSVEEKATMKSTLLQHIATYPISENLFQDRGIPSPFSIRNFRNKKTLSVFIIGGLFLGGSMSFAAENTVPGDILYPVKVHFNEPVRGAIARTSKAKAEWGVRLVERRLEEVEKLAVKTDAHQEAKDTARANLGKYTERVKKHIAKFEEDKDSEGALLTAENLSSVIRKHERIIAGLGIGGGSVSGISMGTTTEYAGSSAVDGPNKEILRIIRSAREEVENKRKDLVGDGVRQREENNDRSGNKVIHK